MADEQPQQSWAGLTPVARPTDQYAAPEVRRQLGGGKLIQLAGALKDTSSVMSDVFQQRIAASQQAAHMQADKLSEERQFKNMQDLNGAVQRNEIPMWANPWFQVRLKQDVARNEATVNAHAVENDLANSQVVHSDNPDDVHNFISERFGKLMQGRDAWEVAAMKPSLDQAHSEMMGRWLQQRGDDRIREARAATGNLVMAKMDGIDPVGFAKGDPDAMKQVEAFTGDIQQQYNTLLHVTDKATASQWVSEAVLEAARVHRNADVAHTVLDRLTGQDGVKLSTLAANRSALEILPREIQELKNADLQAEVTGRKLAGVKESVSVTNAATEWAKKNNRQPWEYTMTPEEFQKLSPEGYEEVQRFYSSLSQQAIEHRNVVDNYAAQPIIQDLLRGTINGQLKAPEKISLMAALALHGEEGQKGVDTFARFLHYQRDIQWGGTTPATLAALNDKIVDASLKPADVMKEIDAGHLDQSTGESLLRMSVDLQASGNEAAKFSPMVQQSVKELHDLVQAPYLKDGLLGGRGDTADADKMKLQEAQADTAFLSEYMNLTKSPDWSTKTFPEKQQQISELRDSISRSYGGMAMQDFIKARDTMQKAPPLSETPKEILPQSPSDHPDKVVAGLDEGTVREAATLAQLPTETPKLEALLRSSLNDSAFSSGRPAPFTGGGVLDSGLAFHVMTARGENPVRNGPTSSKVSSTDLRDYQDGITTIQSLKPLAEAAPKAIQAIREAVAKQGGTINFGQQQELKAQLLRVLAYTDLRQQYGYTPDEVKSMGDGAWRQFRMFANAADMQARGPETAKALGIKPFQLQAFKEAQTSLLPTITNP